MFAHLQVKLIFSFITLRYLNIHKLFFSINTSFSCICCESMSCFSFSFHLIGFFLFSFTSFQATTTGAAKKHRSDHSLIQCWLSRVILNLQLQRIASPSSSRDIVPRLIGTSPFLPCEKGRQSSYCIPCMLKSNRKLHPGMRRTLGQSSKLAWNPYY